MTAPDVRAAAAAPPTVAAATASRTVALDWSLRPVGWGGGPLVIVTGWTASGKTTLAERMSRAGLTPVTGSAMLLPLLRDPEAGKASRLRSWLSPAAEAGLRDGTADRIADLAVLRTIARRDGPMVVDTAGSVPLLLSPYNDGLLIRLDAAPPIRAARVQRLLNDTVTAQEAARIVQRKDATTAGACLAAWGLDLNHPIHHHRYDLTLACPDGAVCADPDRCADAVGQLAEAACRVYAGYLNADDSATTLASTLLGIALDRFRPWVRHACSTLVAPAAPVTAQRWRDRLAHHTAVTDGPRMGAS